jgi:hypothetical protein
MTDARKTTSLPKPGQFAGLKKFISNIICGN